MKKFTSEEYDLIEQALGEKMGSYECSKCHSPSTEHTLVDSFIVMSIRRSAKDDMAFLPFVGVVCTHCGALTMHILQALGLGFLWESMY
ncbi:MAG: hypothetical protein ACFFER_08615 [Candidatus Thorarchaeota archaeon]